MDIASTLIKLRRVSPEDGTRRGERAYLEYLNAGHKVQMPLRQRHGTSFEDAPPTAARVISPFEWYGHPARFMPTTRGGFPARAPGHTDRPEDHGLS